VVLIAGKGHETYQIIGGDKFYFDDREIAREALERIKDEG
jgi:UDP-N-acetylmuramoyl-L-alanyl-D-glutamate--2,6-diaminopimelate ligase